MKTILITLLAVFASLTSGLANENPKAIDPQIHLFKIQIETLTQELRITSLKAYEIQRTLKTSAKLTDAEINSLKSTLRGLEEYRESVIEKLLDKINTHNRYLEQK